jgi:hypothetical protein
MARLMVYLARRIATSRLQDIPVVGRLPGKFTVHFQPVGADV